MPKFDFRCPACGLVFEAVRGFDEAGVPAACPRDGATADRLFSPPADILVRGGFRAALDRRAAATERPRWSHDDLSCHTHEPAPPDHHHEDGHPDQHSEHHDRGLGVRGHGHPHGHAH